MGPGITLNFFEENNIPIPVLIFWGVIPVLCILCVNTLLNVVSRLKVVIMNLSVMSVIGFKKSLDGCWSSRLKKPGKSLAENDDLEPSELFVYMSTNIHQGVPL